MLTMVVLAAGMGSRFGGPKQLVPVGPSGESILDYNVHDALAGGFERVVIVTRPELADRVAALIERGPALGGADVVVTLQHVPAGRTKPWGTAEAVAAAAPHVDGAFAIANADDLYGAASFAALASHLAEHPQGGGAVGFRLGETVPAQGSVSRAVLATSAGIIRDLVEVHGIHRVGDGFAPATVDAVGRLGADTPVSMNLWGLPLEAMDRLNEAAAAFIALPESQRRGEVLLPDVVRSMVAAGLAIRVLETTDRWAGLTNPEDLAGVAAHAAATWPSPLWPTSSP